MANNGAAALLALLGGAVGGYAQGRTMRNQEQTAADQQATQRKDMLDERATQQKNLKDERRRQALVNAPAFWTATKYNPNKVALRQKYIQENELYGANIGVPDEMSMTAGPDGRKMYGKLGADQTVNSDGERIYRNGTVLDPNVDPEDSPEEKAKLSLLTLQKKIAEGKLRDDVVDSGDKRMQGVVGSPISVQAAVVKQENEIRAAAGLPPIAVPGEASGKENIVSSFSLQGPVNPNNPIPSVSRQPILDSTGKPTGGFNVLTPDQSGQTPGTASKVYPVFNPPISPTLDTKYKQAQIRETDAQAAQREAEAKALPAKAAAAYQEAVRKGNIEAQKLIIENYRAITERIKLAQDAGDKEATRQLQLELAKGNWATQGYVAGINAKAAGDRQGSQDVNSAMAALQRIVEADTKDIKDIEGYAPYSQATITPSRFFSNTNNTTYPMGPDGKPLSAGQVAGYAAKLKAARKSFNSRTPMRAMAKYRAGMPLSPDEVKALPEFMRKNLVSNSPTPAPGGGVGSGNTKGLKGNIDGVGYEFVN